MRANADTRLTTPIYLEFGMAGHILARLWRLARFNAPARHSIDEIPFAEGLSRVRELSCEIGKVDRELTVLDARIAAAADELASRRREKAGWEAKVDEAFAINRADLASAASIKANASALLTVQLKEELEALTPRAHGLRDKRKVLVKQRDLVRSTVDAPSRREALR